MNYAPPYVRGDVVGCGYRPRTGTVFFTRNGKKLDDVTHTLKTQNLFPTVGATGPCSVHVNFGQMGFVFIEANVKKWGLAPMTGSLAPPPPYGSEAGSILLEGGHHGVVEGQGWLSTSQSWSGGLGHGHARSRSAQIRLARQQPTSPGPQRSPTDISLTQLSLVDSEDEDAANEDAGEGTSSSASSIQPSFHSHTDTIEGRTHQSLNIEAPPPDYESPEDDDARGKHRYQSDSDDSSTPRPGSAVRSSSEDERSRLLDTRRRASPPIPSYDAAVGSVPRD